jgi:hypothetical protein
VGVGAERPIDETVERVNRGLGRGRLRRRIRLLILLFLLLVSASCVQPVGPARTFDSYQHKAKDTAETALSSVETARLGARAAKRGDVFPSFLSVLLGEAEDEATSAQSTFDSVQPPNKRSDRLRDRLDALLVRATDALSEARIAARRADFDEVARQARPLARSSRELNRFVEAQK